MAEYEPKKYLDTGVCIGGPNDGEQVETDPRLTRLELVTPAPIDCTSIGRFGPLMTTNEYIRETLEGEGTVIAFWRWCEMGIDKALVHLFMTHAQAVAGAKIWTPAMDSRSRHDRSIGSMSPIEIAEAVGRLIHKKKTDEDVEVLPVDPEVVEDSLKKVRRRGIGYLGR